MLLFLCIFSVAFSDCCIYYVIICYHFYMIGGFSLMNPVILSCQTLTEFVRQAQLACHTAFPIVELNREYHSDPAKMRVHILETLSLLLTDCSHPQSCRLRCTCPDHSGAICTRSERTRSYVSVWKR